MIYLDNAATTKPIESVIKQNEYLYAETFFNPSSMHGKGIETKKIVESARATILKRFPPNYDLTFTSCGTEADNTAIFSFCKRGNVVTSLGEHSAVYESFNELKKRGVEVRFAPVNKDGSVNEKGLLSLIDGQTTFVSIVHVNNETGAINDINSLSAKIKAKNHSVVFHSDGIQAFGKIPYQIADSVDLYSVSAHKIGAVKGVGALIKKKRLTLTPLLFGGGQESGLRSGTENVFGIKVFADATEKTYSFLRDNFEKVSKIKDIALKNLNREVLEIISPESGSPYILTLSAKGLRGEVIMHMLEEFGVYVGTGSACSSKNPHSRILKACGYSSALLDGVIRLSFCVDTTEEEVSFAIEKLNECVKRLKGIMKK